MLKYCLILVLLVYPACAYAQLKPGFDAGEYLELLRISRQQMDTSLRGDFTPKPERFHMIYRSAEGPLKNRWELWVDHEKTAIISIRGSVESNNSWIENFYAAMVPATGNLHLNDSTNFAYHLANNPRAAIHIGWLLGMADISTTVIQKINQVSAERGIHNFIISGHSQGAAIAYLLRSYLADQQEKKNIPANLTFKTYCSAPPKPGNTYYAYAYDYLTRGGWGFAVINAADWVPEVPLSIQTLNDFNAGSPFTKIDTLISKQPFFVRLYARHVYNQIRKPPLKAVKNNQKYLGHLLYKMIKKSLPQFIEPDYAPTNLYAQCGTPIILMPDEDYRKKFPDDPQNLFVDHMFWPYYYLTQKQYGAN